eukprot:5202975-Pleurochrysis_carterae.AAC.5
MVRCNTFSVNCTKYPFYLRRAFPPSTSAFSKPTPQVSANMSKSIQSSSAQRINRQSSIYCKLLHRFKLYFVRQLPRLPLGTALFCAAQLSAFLRRHRRHDQGGSAEREVEERERQADNPGDLGARERKNERGRGPEVKREREEGRGWERESRKEQRGEKQRRRKGPGM